MTTADGESARAVRYHSYGAPTDVLRVEDDVKPGIAPDEVLVRTRFVPLHRGDMLAIAGSPAFGSAPTLPAGGTIPGMEGMGVIEAVGGAVDGFAIGQRVAYLPVSGSWRTHAATKASALVAVPDDVPDELAARLMIDVATACLIVRRALHDQPRPERILQSGASSGVGRLISALLVEAGVQPIRLAHGESGARKAESLVPDSPVFATAIDGWRDAIDAILGNDLPTVAIDGVGGDQLGDVAMRLSEGGLILQYGTLGGTRADIRPIVPRRLRIEGMSLGAWFDLPAGVRAGDVATALRLARERPALFGDAGVFEVADVIAAVGAMDAPGRDETILISFDGAR